MKPAQCKMCCVGGILVTPALQKLRPGITFGPRKGRRRWHRGYRQDIANQAFGPVFLIPPVTCKRVAVARAFRFSKECTGTDHTKIFSHGSGWVV
jgi:hypothetical protein